MMTAQEIAASTQICCAVLGKDSENCCIVPLDADCDVDATVLMANASGYHYAGVFGRTVDGQIRVWFGSTADVPIMASAVYQFVKYVTRCLTETPRTEADWLRKLYTMPDTRPN
jgi:hypothetical protein